MKDRILPLNIPIRNIRRYELAFDKGYGDMFKIIYKLGCYITFQQFYTLYSKLNPTLSTKYVEKKANIIIKEIAENKFIEIDILGKHKYFYLKAPALAFATGDYKKIPKLNHKSRSSSNNKLTSSFLKVEYYLATNELLESDIMFIHLKQITKKIISYAEEYSLNYDKNLLISICNSTDYEYIQSLVSKLPSDNIIYILWINLLNIYLKLRKQGQTISPSPLHFKLYVNDGSLNIHYVPEIVIIDTHKIDYYSSKMDNILSDLISIKSNTIYNLSNTYTPNNILGDCRLNIIGYGLKLIGSDSKALKNKSQYIIDYAKSNINSPFCTINTVEVDLSKYFSYSYRKLDIVEKIDNQIESIVSATLERVLS